MNSRAVSGEILTERGITLVTFMLFLPVILVAVAFVLDLGYHSLILQELKVATNAAALAGTRSLVGRNSNGVQCPNEQCWEEARKVAMATLGEQQLRGGRDQSLDVTYVPEYAADLCNVLDLSMDRNLKVTVERGIWGRFDRESSVYTFRSLDGFKSKEGNCGSPDVTPVFNNPSRFIIANAVRVTVSRPRTPYSIGRYLGYDTSNLSASSVAVVNTPRGVRAAPFALAPCTLLKRSGNREVFDPRDLDAEDRLFRHGAVNAEESGHPAFLYRIQSRSSSANPAPCPGICPLGVEPDLGYRHFFGVVGEPGAIDTSKETIARMFGVSGGKEEDGTKESFIGEPFAVLDEGLNDVNLFRDLLAEKVFRNDNTFSSVFGSFPEPLEHKIDKSCGLNARLTFGLCPGYRANPWRGLNFFLDPHVSRVFGDQCAKKPRARPDYQPSELNRGVWKARIPIIEALDEESPSCDLYMKREGRNFSHFRWTIVGFASVNIFDFGLGEAALFPSSNPLPCSYVRGRISREDIFIADSEETPFDPTGKVVPRIALVE